MDWQERINHAIDYIEDNLAGEIDLAVAANHMSCSVWEFQRFFSFMTHISLGEYIRGRRLTLAADDIRSGHEKIIDIALKYGYDSPAAFSRAFGQLHGVSPSSARSGGAVLRSYPKITFESYNKERVFGMRERNSMERYSERGYYVRENAPVYFTEDMDRTCRWFCDVLGWYGDVCARDENGAPVYGCVFDYPGELIVTNLTPFRGIHLFPGTPIKGVAGFISVQNLDRLHALVKQNGWEQISEIYAQSWGARECSVTTPDGCVLRFFETVS